MKENILVSIITVCYNSEKTIKKTIESVLNQTYRNIEYILVDGLSKDSTLNIIKSYEEDFIDKGISYKWISESDMGIYDAMNKGISITNGELIGIINSDDWYELNAIGNIVENYEEGVDVYHGYLRFIENEKEQMIKRTNSEQLKKGEMIEHPTCFLNRRVYEKHGKYSLEYKSASDLDFFINLKDNLEFKAIDVVVANFRVNGISASILGLKETIFIRYKNGLMSKKKYLLNIFRLELKKYLLKQK